MSIVMMVITACLSGSSCRDFPFPLDASITVRMCVQQGQFGLAEWAGNHPAYTIRRWRCEPAGQYSSL